METLEQRLIREEGNKLYVYDDATGKPIVPGSHVVGNPTIAVGVLLTSAGGITAEESLYLFRNRLNAATTRVDNHIPLTLPLTPDRRDVLIDMVFQMGLGAVLAFRHMFAALDRGDYGAAADAMLDSDWARKTPARAAALAVIMRNGTADLPETV